MRLPFSKKTGSSREKVPFDLVFFGALMIVSGIMDTYIILANPNYGLPVFGNRLTGPIGWFFKFLSPVLHFFAGYGAILARKWALLLFVFYSIFGIINAMTNRLLLPPPHRIRTIFIAVILVFLAYLFFRRKAFKT